MRGDRKGNYSFNMQRCTDYNKSYKRHQIEIDAFKKWGFSQSPIFQFSIGISSFKVKKIVLG